MIRTLMVCSVMVLGQAAMAQTVITGDAWFQGTLTAGTTVAGARLEVKASTTVSAVFQVSGVDETPFLVILSSGDVGLGVLPAARLDASGVGDFDYSALVLRNGNLSPATGRYQITFGENGASNRRHALRSVHVSSTAGNGIDFLLWTPSDGVSAVGTLGVFSVVTTTAGSSVHVRPVGSPVVDLVVSDGSMTGGGAVHRAAEVTPSSRGWKTDISFLGADEEDRAAGELEGLRHARFRYKKWTSKGLTRSLRQPMRRGLIYEEVPEGLKGPGKSIAVYERINELELAMKSLLRRLEAAEAEVGR